MAFTLRWIIPVALLLATARCGDPEADAHFWRCSCTVDCSGTNLPGGDYSACLDNDAPSAQVQSTVEQSCSDSFTEEVCTCACSGCSRSNTPCTPGVD